jgi:hypothetical protein
MTTKKIYVCTVHELPNFVSSKQTDVHSIVTRCMIPDWVKPPSPKYMFYTIEIEQTDYDNKMQRFRLGSGVHTALFSLWIRNLVRPRSAFADTMVPYFGSDDFQCDCDVLPVEEMVVIGGYNHGIFIGIPHDGYITGLSSFV